MPVFMYTVSDSGYVADPPIALAEGVDEPSARVEAHKVILGSEVLVLPPMPLLPATGGRWSAEMPPSPRALRKHFDT